MHSSLFFKLFPPPKFLLMPYTGIDLSDDEISFIEYSPPTGRRWIVKYGSIPLESGIIDGGDIKDEKKLITILADMVKQHDLHNAKLSIPEEKAYLFETEVPYADLKTISQNIEFKLEENIPLAAPDAVFAFDLLSAQPGKPLRASVSAVPRTYIERMMGIFRSAGITPVSFETIPRAIARIVSHSTEGDTIVIHTMKRKTGVYIVSQFAVGFTSTIATGKDEVAIDEYTTTLESEISRVHSYWQSKNAETGSVIKRVVVTGHDAERVTTALRMKLADFLPVEVIDVWHSVLDTRTYVPPISKSDSFRYVSAAGLAI